MEILILSWRGIGHPCAGGAEIATHEHAKSWVKAGHNVIVFTSYFKGCKKIDEIDGVKILRRSKQIIGVQIAVFFWYFFGKHPKFDIVVDQFHGVPFFTPLYVKTKILAYIHEVATQVWKKNELPQPFNLLVSVIGPVIEPFIFTLYKKMDFLTVSESTRTDLITFGIKKQKISIIHNGVTRIKTKNTKKEKIITFLGMLNKDKGVEDAIDLFSEVMRKDENWEFYIVGKGRIEYMHKLKEKVRVLNVNSSIKFLGFVSDRKKFEILAKSFCLINPSIHEGWGLVNIEANSVGTPVFAYKVKGISDSVVDGKTGILFNKGDIRQMALEIIKLANDKKRYEIFSMNCINWSNKFSWEKSTKESTLLIESL